MGQRLKELQNEYEASKSNLPSKRATKFPHVKKKKDTSYYSEDGSDYEEEDDDDTEY